MGSLKPAWRKASLETYTDSVKDKTDTVYHISARQFLGFRYFKVVTKHMFTDEYIGYRLDISFRDKRLMRFCYVNTNTWGAN